MSTTTPHCTMASIIRFGRSNAAVIKPVPGSRFVLWIDAVGAFLVCRGNKVVLGQAVPGTMADIPLLADVSRFHAAIRRDPEGYVVEPVQEVRLGGTRITSATCLAQGSVLQLGRAVRMKFQRPHPLSATARLDFVSHHHMQPSTAGVLLMADSCVLGPSPNCHVVCRRWPQDVVLYQQQGELFCRTKGAFEIDGRRYSERGPLSLSSRVVGEEFSFSLEAI